MLNLVVCKVTARLQKVKHAGGGGGGARSTPVPATCIPSAGQVNKLEPFHYSLSAN
jgi:hypothetical protein